jgi:hypothetical protein
MFVSLRIFTCTAESSINIPQKEEKDWTSYCAHACLSIESSILSVVVVLLQISNTHTHTHTHTHTRKHTHTRAHTRARAHTHNHKHAHTRARTQCTHAHMDTHARATQNTIEQMLLYLTFSELCIVIHKREKDQEDAHIFFIHLFQLNYPLYVSNKQLFIIMRLFQSHRVSS